MIAGFPGAAEYNSIFTLLDGKVTKVNLLADLKNLTPVLGMKVLLVAKLVLGDGLGGFYMWDETATGSEDTTFMNVIPSNVTATGRWVRIFQKARPQGNGAIVLNGGVKTLYISGTTDANGDATVNLTEDGTPTGVAIFKEIWAHNARCTADATGPATAVSSYLKTLATDKKVLTYGQFRANAVTVTLGLVYSPFAAAPSGLTVQFTVEGV